MWRRESQVLNKSFNTLCLQLFSPKWRSQSCSILELVWAAKTGFLSYSKQERHWSFRKSREKKLKIYMGPHRNCKANLLDWLGQKMPISFSLLNECTWKLNGLFSRVQGVFMIFSSDYNPCSHPLRTWSLVHTHLWAMIQLTCEYGPVLPGHVCPALQEAARPPAAAPVGPAVQWERPAPSLLARAL